MGPVNRVAFQGERGAFSDEAVRLHFGPEAESVPCRTFADVFHSVAAGRVDYGLVPVENSIAGGINEVYDLLRRYDLYIRGERVLRVRHCLLALPGQSLAEIRRVYSHPAALDQCEGWLREAGVEAVAQYDTAGSARLVAEERLQGVGAIASRWAAEIYGLAVVAEDIQDVKDNYTRFVVLGRDALPRQEGPAKTALVMSTAHSPGALYQCLGAFARRGINLLNLESRPAKNRPWEYVFYLDLDGHRDDPAVAEALAEMAAHTSFLKVLGSFPRDVTMSGSGAGDAGAAGL